MRTYLRRLGAAVVALAAALAGSVAYASSAVAHGEQNQVAFLRASTVVIYDVKYSASELKVNDPITITGTVRIMESWPAHTVAAPEIGYLSVIVPGPVLVVEERRLNGVPTPESVLIHRGATYDFVITARARVPGRHHLHPSFSVKGVGTLVGRGQWIEIAEGAESFRNRATIATSGREIDLNTVGRGQVMIWHLIGFLIGLAYLLYWVLRRPVVARVAAAEGGRGKELITRQDQIVGVAFAVLALATIGIGYWGTRFTVDEPLLPLQVARVHPPDAPAEPALVKSRIDQAAYHESTDVVEFTMTVTNTTTSPVKLARLQIAEEEFQDALTITPSAEVAAGQTRTLTVAIKGSELREYNLLPLAEPQIRLTGLLFFTDAEGREQVSEVDEVTSPILPRG